MFSRNRRLFRKSGWRRGLDRGDDSADEGMEGPVLSGKAISSSPYLRHSAAWAFTGPLFLWRKRLLPGRLSDLAIVSRYLSNGKKTIFYGRSCPAFWLHLG